MKPREQAAANYINEHRKNLNGDSVFTITRSDLYEHWNDAFLAGCEFEAQNRWIPVSERLPEKVGAYLTYRSNGITIIEHWYNTRDSDYLWKDCYSVTHWQPLPSPPKPQEL